MADDDRPVSRGGNGNNGNVRRLVIVESPTKARKIAGYLGRNYVVESSRGHIRDLLKGAADVPGHKTEKWAPARGQRRRGLRTALRRQPGQEVHGHRVEEPAPDVDELHLATDGDREGEAIAWHLLQTPQAPRAGPAHGVPRDHRACHPGRGREPRDLDTDLVDARQETRRILDRLYGYEVSPVLWKKVAPKLSAGRVQSVATRIIVQRERERMAFRSASYWDVLAELDASVSDATATPPRFNARLVAVDGKRAATGRDFDSLGALRKPAEVTVLDEAAAGARWLQACRAPSLTVASVEEKPHTRRPYRRSMTSTLQQEVGRKLWFTAERTHERGPEAVRERLHHLYAHRLHDAVGVGHQRRAQSGPPALRGRIRPPVAPAVHPQG